MSDPTRTTDPGRTTDPTRADRVRQVVVAVGAVLAVVGAAIGSGAAGGQPIAQAADGALSAEATVVAPGSPAFSIWSVIYVGLVLFAVVQALPGRAADPRMRAVGWWVLASMLLNAVWIGVVQAGWLWGSVVVIACLVVVLCVVLLRLLRLPSARVLDAVASEVTVGLYLGWVCVATLANVAAALTASEVGGLGLGATGWGTVLAAVAALIVVGVGVRAARRPMIALAVGLAACWGLAWIAVARSQGPLVDQTVALAAGVAAAVAVVGPAVAVLRARSTAS